MPGGRVSKGLLVALRALLAPSIEFECWGSVLDVLPDQEEEQQQQQEQQEEQQEEQEEQQGGKKRSREEATAGRQQEGAKRQRQDASAAGAAAGSAAAGGEEAGEGGGPLPLHPAVVLRFDHCASLKQHLRGLSPAMLGVIKAALLERLARYPGGLAAGVPPELQRLGKAAGAVKAAAAAARAGAGGGAARAGKGGGGVFEGAAGGREGGEGGGELEHAAALRAAQVLQLAEKTMLLEALETLC
jgi:hypothetical protein